MKNITRRSFAAMGVSALLALTLAGCGSNAASSSAAASDAASSAASASASSAAAATMVLDMNGDEVIEAGTAKNVLTVNSVATQMVLMVGGEDAAATVGQGFQYDDGTLNKKMFPNLGDRKTFTRDDATVENVAAVDPGMVVIDVPDTVTALREAGIPTAFMAVTSPETIMDAVQLVGDALGGDAAQKASDYRELYEGTLEEMAAKAKDVADADKPRVLYLRNETKTIGEGSMPDNWITTVGGKNVGAELGANGGAGSDVTTEAVIGSNPDIIVCERPDLFATITTDAQYADLDAVKNGKVYLAPFGTAVWSMGTAEAVCMLPWAGTIINPDLYKDVDIDKITTDFFKDFYGYTLSQDELDTIFAR